MRIDTRYIPDGLPENDKKLAGLLDELSRLDAQHAGAFKARDIASRKLDTAPGSDSALYASALRAGKADPGPVAQRIAEEKVAAAQRTLDAAEIASGQVADEISEHVKTNLTAMLTRAANAEQRARFAITEPLARIENALHQMRTAAHSAAWAKAVAGCQPYIPAAAPDTAVVVTVPGSELGTTKADRITWHAVYDALRDLADPARVEQREEKRSRSLAAGVAQNLSPAELVHGRGAVPAEQPAG